MTPESKSQDPQTKKAWVTPEVSESPVNELTLASFAGSGADAGVYS
jgi:hypothetical protein